MINKIAMAITHALQGIRDGDVVLLGGPGTAGICNKLIVGLIDHGASGPIPFQVSVTGDFDHWYPGEKEAVPGVGATELAIGAKQTWIMSLLTGSRDSKIVERCSHLLRTGIAFIQRVHIDPGSFKLTPADLHLLDAVEGLEHSELVWLADMPLAGTAS